MNSLARPVAFLIIALLIAAVPPIEGSSSGIHNQAGSGCTCHTNNNGGGMTATHNFPSTYMGGMMYSISINLNGGTQSFNGGFNVVVDKGNLLNAGAGVKIDTAQKSATHQNRGQLGWAFDWMAPSGNAGTTTVEIAVLQADASNTNNGDQWHRLTVTIPESLPPNDAPTASSVSVTPSPEARTDEALTLSYQYNDNDGDPESGTTIQWYVNGAVNTAHDGKSTIAASLTSPGQTWKAEVTPSDGTDAGQAVMSNEITIVDIDSDNDGVLDGQDAFPNDPSETTDSDGDGVGDNGDDDDDNDGVVDDVDAFPLDPSTWTELAVEDDDGGEVSGNVDDVSNKKAGLSFGFFEFFIAVLSFIVVVTYVTREQD